uniref:Uncharacterized protein n=1 Tax=Anguilla anguilla TaxID=7936 RepID=A0A0E9U2J0_ANGAN
MSCETKSVGFPFFFIFLNSNNPNILPS